MAAINGLYELKLRSIYDLREGSRSWLNLCETTGANPATLESARTGLNAYPNVLALIDVAYDNRLTPAPAVPQAGAGAPGGPYGYHPGLAAVAPVGTGGLAGGGAPYPGEAAPATGGPAGSGAAYPPHNPDGAGTVVQLERIAQRFTIAAERMATSAEIIATASSKLPTTTLSVVSPATAATAASAMSPSTLRSVDSLKSRQSQLQEDQRKYEESCRNMLPAWLAKFAGLIVVDDQNNLFGTHRVIEMAGGAAEWDFRAPVVIDPSWSPPSSQPDDDFMFVYVKNAPFNRAEVRDVRHLTPPRKLPSGKEVACPAHYLAIAEITTGRISGALLGRLEKRLIVTLDRARAADASLPEKASICDVVAIVALVTPDRDMDTVRTVLDLHSGKLGHLFELFAHRRFVHFTHPFAATQEG